MDADYVDPETGKKHIQYTQLDSPNTLRESFGFTLDFKVELENEFSPQLELSGSKIISKDVEYKGIKLGDVEITPSIYVDKDGNKIPTISYIQYKAAIEQKYKEQTNSCKI